MGDVVISLLWNGSGYWWFERMTLFVGIPDRKRRLPLADHP